MENSYSINEILLAVNEIQNLKNNKKNKIVEKKDFQKDNSPIPKNTLELIEEAENFKLKQKD